MINPKQFVDEILEPTLKAINMYSVDAMHLMFRTALVESHLTHIRQLPKGRGLGFMQVEMATHIDVVRYLKTRPDITARILNYLEYTQIPTKEHNLIGNTALNVVAARVKYWMQPEPLPSYKDIDAQADYYLKYYNTALGAATHDAFTKIASQSAEFINE